MQQTITPATNMNTQAYGALAGRKGQAGVKRHRPNHMSKIKEAAERAAKEDMEPIGHGFVHKILMFTFILFVFSLLLYVAANIFGDDISRGGHSASTDELEVVIGKEVMNIPENIIRYASQRRNGTHQKLDLYIHWPSLSGYTDDLQHDFNHSSEDADLIFITLEKRNMAYDMSGRISPIYTRFFVGKPENYKAGLVKQALNSEGGFIDEDLYYAAGSPYPFATRCVRENSNVGTPYCMRDIHITKNLSLTYRFHKRMLADWITIDKTLRHYIKAMFIKHS